MDDQKELLKYFIEQTNERFNKIDQKLDTLITFRILLIGGSAVASAAVSFAVTIFFK